MKQAKYIRKLFEEVVLFNKVLSDIQLHSCRCCWPSFFISVWHSGGMTFWRKTSSSIAEQLFCHLQTILKTVLDGLFQDTQALASSSHHLVGLLAHLDILVQLKAAYSSTPAPSSFWVLFSSREASQLTRFWLIHIRVSCGSVASHTQATTDFFP